MIKLVTFLKRSAELTRPQFEERWLTVHAPMASAFPGLRGYVLGFSVEPDEPPADGVAQLWFDSRLDAQASYASDIGCNGSTDANAYLSRREHLLAAEEWRSNSASLEKTPFKLLVAAKRKVNQLRQDFVTSWSQALPDIGAVCGSTQIRLCVDDAGQLLNSATEGSLALRDGEAAFDGLLEVWFPSEDMALFGAQRYRSELRPQLASQVAALEDAVLKEHVIVRPPQPAY